MMDKLHDLGVAHCDLSWVNMMLDVGSGEMSIIDFGQARSTGTFNTANEQKYLNRTHQPM